MTVSNGPGGRVSVYVVNTSGTYSATISTPTGTALTLAAPTAKGSDIPRQVASALRALGYSETTEVEMRDKGNDGNFRTARTFFVRDGQMLSGVDWDGSKHGSSIFEGSGDSNL